MNGASMKIVIKTTSNLTLSNGTYIIDPNVT